MSGRDTEDSVTKHSMEASMIKEMDVYFNIDLISVYKVTFMASLLLVS